MYSDNALVRFSWLPLFTCYTSEKQCNTELFYWSFDADQHWLFSVEMPVGASRFMLADVQLLFFRSFSGALTVLVQIAVLPTKRHPNIKVHKKKANFCWVRSFRLYLIIFTHIYHNVHNFCMFFNWIYSFSSYFRGICCWPIYWYCSCHSFARQFFFNSTIQYHDFR